MLNNKNYAIMEKVVLLSFDVLDKDFKIIKNVTFACTDIKTASRVLMLATDTNAKAGCKINNARMKQTKLWNKKEFEND